MCGCAVCAYDLIEVRGHFAQHALGELNVDPAWERRVAGLAQMFPGPPESPL